MADLTGKTPADTFKSLVQFPTDADGVTGSLQTLEDGKGIATVLQLSTSTVNVDGTFSISGTASEAFTTAEQTNLGNQSGTNTGDQTITLTGDVTGSGTGSFAATIADNAVTLAKMAGGTAGNLITFDASGDPAAVATGTAGQVLKSNGVGTAPTFQSDGGVSLSDANEWTKTQNFNATTLPAALGADLVTNGGFGADTDWTKGTGWTIAAGVASSDGTQAGDSDLTQTISIVNGDTYQVVFAVSNYASGSVTPVVGDTEGTDRSSNAAFTEYIVAGAGGDIDIRADAGFVGSVDVVTVKRTNAAWDVESNQVTSITLGSNITIDNPTNVVDGAIYTIRITQDAPGNRTVTWGTAYVFETSADPELSSVGNHTDILTFIGDASGNMRLAYISHHDLTIANEYTKTQNFNATSLATITQGVINGTFAIDAFWTKGTGWSIGSGVASSDASQSADSNLYQQVPNAVNGKSYETSFAVTNYVAGNITFVAGSLSGVGGQEGTDRAANGTFVETIIASQTGEFGMRADLDFDGDVDNITAFLLNIPWDLEANQVTTALLTKDNMIFDNPTNMKDGATYIMRAVQDSSGSRVVTWGSAFLWPGGTAPTLSTGVDAVDVISFLSDGTSMYGVFQGDFQ